MIAGGEARGTVSTVTCAAAGARGPKFLRESEGVRTVTSSWAPGRLGDDVPARLALRKGGGRRREGDPVGSCVARPKG